MNRLNPYISPITSYVWTTTFYSEWLRLHIRCYMIMRYITRVTRKRVMIRYLLYTINSFYIAIFTSIDG